MGKLLLLCGVLGFLVSKEVEAQSGVSPTAFGYQGHLTEDDQLANGTYDLRVTLHDAEEGGSLIAGPVTNIATQVHLGLFTTVIDFRRLPSTGQHWLEFSVRQNPDGVAFVTLVPRQPILAVPEAGRAAEATLAYSLKTTATPNAPSVVLAPSRDTSAPTPGGIAWLDPDGDFAAGLVAGNRSQLDFSLTRPLKVYGSAFVVGGESGDRTDPGTNALQVLGGAQFLSPIQANGGIQFPDGSRLTSATTFQQPNVLWVSTHGNDRTAIRGDPTRPWRTIGTAITHSISGDAVLILPGRYIVRTVPELGAKRIAAPIRVVGRTNLTITGFGGVPEIYAPDFGDIIQVVSCQNLTFRNLHLRSNASELPAPPHGQSAGICFRPDEPANVRVLIDGCRFTGVPHAITTFAAPAVTTDHLTVRDCNFVNCGWTTGVPTLGQDGGALTGFGNHMRFVNNTLDGAIRGIEFYRFPGDPGHTNALISGNIFLNYWDCAICSFDDGDENQATLDSVVITDNLFEDAPHEVPGGEFSGSAAILINSGRRITIRGNLVNRGKLYGIKVSALTGPLEYVDITANAVSDVAGRGIQITDYGPGVQHVRVANNRIWGNSGGGILAQGRYLDLAFNDIASNYPAGIRIQPSESGRLTSDSRVYGNSLIGNASALMTEGMTNVLIEANHVILPEVPEPTDPDPASGPTGARLQAQKRLAGPNPDGKEPRRTAPKRTTALKAWQNAANGNPEMQ